MTEKIHPIARALLEGGDESSRKVPCAVCKQPAELPDFIFESVKLWNRQEWEMAEREHRRADMITLHELGIACSQECRVKLHRAKHAESEQENATTASYLSLLHAGRYNPESLTWLRRRGYAKTVERLLAKEGTVKAHVG